MQATKYIERERALRLVLEAAAEDGCIPDVVEIESSNGEWLVRINPIGDVFDDSDLWRLDKKKMTIASGVCSPKPGVDPSAAMQEVKGFSAALEIASPMQSALMEI